MMDKKGLPNSNNNMEWFEELLTSLADHINEKIHNNIEGNHDFYLLICSEEIKGHSCIISNTEHENILESLSDHIGYMINGFTVAAGKYSKHTKH